MYTIKYSFNGLQSELESIWCWNVILQVFLSPVQIIYFFYISLAVDSCFETS